MVAQDGKLGRQLAECLGDDMVGLLRRTSERDYWPRLVGFKDRLMGQTMIHRGEFMPQLHAYRLTGRPEFLPMLGGGAGFTSLSDMISEAAAGKQQELIFAGKVGSTQATAGIAETLWNAAGVPGAGANPAALAGGTVPTNATAGSLQQVNPTGGDTQHFAGGAAFASVCPSVVILYDRLWHGAVAMSSTANQTASGTITRNTGGIGNVIMPEIRTVLAAVAHNNTVLYTNTASTAGQSTGAVAGISSGAAQRLDFNVAGNWCMPLAAGDIGVKNITQYTSSGSVTSGQIDLVLGSPIAFIPCPLVGLPGFVDGINSAFNLTRIEDGACLAMSVLKGAATASALFSGQIITVAG